MGWERRNVRGVHSPVRLQMMPSLLDTEVALFLGRRMMADNVASAPRGTSPFLADATGALKLEVQTLASACIPAGLGQRRS